MRANPRRGLPALGLILLCLSPVVLPPAPAAGQHSRDQMLRDWHRSRDAVLAFAEAMPEEHLGFRPTPGVRTWAEQIEHIVMDNVRILAMAFADGEVPEVGDRERYLVRSDELVAHVRAGYDFVISTIRGVSDEDLHREVVLFGRVRVPGWRAIEIAREHATWTLGQTIPYLRLNGVQPPTYPMFHASEVESPGG